MTMLGSRQMKKVIVLFIERASLKRGFHLPQYLLLYLFPALRLNYCNTVGRQHTG